MPSDDNVQAKRCVSCEPDMFFLDSLSQRKGKCMRSCRKYKADELPVQPRSDGPTHTAMESSRRGDNRGQAARSSVDKADYHLLRFGLGHELSEDHSGIGTLDEAEL